MHPTSRCRSTVVLAVPSVRSRCPPDVFQLLGDPYRAIGAVTVHNPVPRLHQTQHRLAVVGVEHFEEGLEGFGLLQGFAELPDGVLVGYRIGEAQAEKARMGNLGQTFGQGEEGKLGGAEYQGMHSLTKLKLTLLKIHTRFFTLFQFLEAPLG